MLIDIIKLIKHKHLELLRFPILKKQSSVRSISPSRNSSRPLPVPPSMDESLDLMKHSYYEASQSINSEFDTKYNSPYKDDFKDNNVSLLIRQLALRVKEVSDRLETIDTKLDNYK